MPIIASVIIYWRYLKKTDSSAASESAGSDPHAIDSLLTWFWEFSSSWDPPSKFWCKHMPPNFWIKVILFQNYPVCILDWSTTMGREPWSGVHRSSPLASIHESMPKTFVRAPLFHGHLDSSSQASYKTLIRPWREQLTTSAMFLFHPSFRVLPTPLDPPWPISLQ